MSKAEDPLIDCPLDVVHRIRKSRMQTHLVKCLKNFKLSSSSKVKCPFNPLHIVETIELMHHCKSCPDSENVILDQFETEGEKCYSGIISFEEVKRQYDEVVPQNYEWEKYTINTTAYDPSANIENVPVFRSLNCESKSKRREFRFRERKRFADLDHNAAKSPVQEQVPSQVKPLRPPHSVFQNKAAAVKVNPAEFVPIDKPISDGTKNRVEESVKGKPDANQSKISEMAEGISPVLTKKNNGADSKNKLKTTGEGSEATLNILDDVEVESITDCLSELNVLEMAEIAIKQRKSKLINIVSANNAASAPRSTISYRDAAVSKSNGADNGTSDKKSPISRMSPKCAANFNVTDAQSNSEDASCSYKNPRLPRSIAHPSRPRNQ